MATALAAMLFDPVKGQIIVDDFAGALEAAWGDLEVTLTRHAAQDSGAFATNGRPFFQQPSQTKGATEAAAPAPIQMKISYEIKFILEKL